MGHVADQTDASCPGEVSEYAARAVDYVHRAIGLELEFDSDTLPLLDHYLRSVPESRSDLRDLVTMTAGAYFGELVRRRLGGRWDLSAGTPDLWRVVLPTGLTFAPAGIVAETVAQGAVDGLDTAFDVPALLRPHLDATLARMGEVTVEEYYSLCGRLDTLEHVQEVLLAVAAEMASKRPDTN